MPLHDREQIQSLLETMRRGATADARLAAARTLFAQLNYDPARKPLALQLSDETRKQLSSPPAVIATACDDQSFLIIHTQLASESLSRTSERAVVSAMLKDHPYALFVFSNRDHSHWHLLNVKVARKEVSDENRDVKLRRLFRRISIAPEDRLRTAIERIEKLDVAFIHPELFGMSPLAVQEAHDDAFDVEAVTRQFFQEYKRVFEYVEEAITGIRGPEKRRLFTQRLFNRLMFIAFIQRKGWLKFPGMEDNQYIEAIWNDYQDKKKEDSNFYTDRLTHLFFRGLNNAAHVDMLATNRGHSAPESFLQRRIGDVPYLNGGLFEKSDDGTDESDAGIAIPDKAINAILHELFARFNFTVAESTPLDIEVAVDPEMLGKVFEELVTGRHESGSYYTPKPIVSFMCREAIKGYLKTKCSTEKTNAIERFVDEHDASGLSDGESILTALKTIRCCDPACGSGAYLLGMMHELLDLRLTLFKTNQKLDPVNVYQRKLEIIQTNVYGVDLDPFAVNIARLRLWLSLAVEFDGDAPPPLPNLDFKIESGDSLAAPDPSGGFDPGFQAAMVDDFLDLKRQFLMSHSTEKKELKKRIDKLREKIMGWTGFNPEPGIFHWQVEFAEVFVRGGFDCVLANPPYVRQELIKDQKPRLKTVFGPLFSGQADLYVYFYLRGLQLLAPGGMLVYISSNKWFRAGYGEKLRAHIAQTTTVQTILDFHDLPVFEATAYPMVFTAAKRPPSETHSTSLAEPPNLEPPYPDVKAIVEKYGYKMPVHALGRDGTWHLQKPAIFNQLDKMRNAGPELATLVDNKIYAGIKTGLNSAFIVNAALRKQLISDDARSKDVIKPYVKGKDIDRWRTESGERFIIYVPHGTKIDEYPAIKRHLTPFRAELEARALDQKWFELQQPQFAFTNAYRGTKIVYPNVALGCRFTMDTGSYLDMTAFCIVSSDTYLLAVLNSSWMSGYFAELGIARRGGYQEFKSQYVRRLPIPDAPRADRSAIGALAQKCLDARGVGCEAWEKEIDERVAALYGL